MFEEEAKVNNENIFLDRNPPNLEVSPQRDEYNQSGLVLRAIAGDQEQHQLEVSHDQIQQ